MSQYLVLIYGDEAVEAAMTPEQWDELLAQHDAYAKEIVDRGATVVAGAALQPSGTATAVRGGPLVSDGPFLTVKEQLGGFYLIDAPDLDVALELAKRCPAPSGGVELRPVMEMDR